MTNLIIKWKHILKSNLKIILYLTKKNIFSFLTPVIKNPLQKDSNKNNINIKKIELMVFF
jgi:hypothetical protein